MNEEDGLKTLDGLLHSIQVLHAEARAVANESGVHFDLELVIDNKGASVSLHYDPTPLKDEPWF